MSAAANSVQSTEKNVPYEGADYNETQTSDNYSACELYSG